MDWEDMQVSEIETSLSDRIAVLKNYKNPQERPVVNYYFSTVM